MKKIILNIVKYAICKCLWYFIITQISNWIPDFIITRFIINRFYIYIYIPIFNYVFDKSVRCVIRFYYWIKGNLAYIYERLW
jgi:hypothetical protein